MEGEGLSTNELYFAAGRVCDSWKPRACVCLPSHWQMREINSVSFFPSFPRAAPPVSFSPSMSPLSFSSQICRFCSVTGPPPSRASAWSAMHYPSLLHFVLSSSPRVAATCERHAHAATIPLALIFQRRHSVRRWPCHRLLPGEDSDPGSARPYPPTSPPGRAEAHSADLGAELALCLPLPGVPPRPPSHPHRHQRRWRCVCVCVSGVDRRKQKQVRGRRRGDGNKMSCRDAERGCVGGLWGAD